VSTTATKPSSKSAAQTRKSFAVQYLEDLVFEIMLNTGQAGKSREIASQLDSIIKLHPKFVRKTLFQSDRFEMEERRWNLALRTMTQLSFEGSIEHTLRDYGKPMSQQALQNEMAMIHRRPVDFYNDILPATLRKRAQYWQAPDGCWLLKDWVLDVSESDPDRCFLRNFFLQAEEARPLVEMLLDTRMAIDQPSIEMAIKLLRRAGQPVSNKVLGYVVWRLRDGKLDPVKFLQECRQEARLLLLSGLTWDLQESVEDYQKDLKTLSRRAEKEEDVAWAEEDEPEGPIVITPADVEEVHKLLKRKKHPQPTSLIAEAVFEHSPASRRFQESVDALTSALTLDTRFVRVGSQTWALPDMMPSHTDRVPESLLPVPVEVREDEADLELEDEGLEPVLVALRGLWRGARNRHQPRAAAHRRAALHPPLRPLEGRHAQSPRLRPAPLPVRVRSPVRHLRRQGEEEAVPGLAQLRHLAAIRAEGLVRRAQAAAGVGVHRDAGLDAR